ncbi:MAG: hypothetical protein KUG78_13345 [Kangiellaceae bacterium]|nr:hypothetical protein [Kangiellaceae bacterium]
MVELPPSLAYYGSYQGALQIIQHQMLPVFPADELRDPFLPNQHSEMGFDCQELFELAVKYMTSAILGKSSPKGNPNHPLQKAIRRWRGENRFNDEAEVRESLVSLLPAMVETQFNDAEKIHQNWLDYIRGKRVLPLFEQANHSELWLMEADRYAGVVIKFACDDDSIFEQCLPAHYDKQPPKTVKIQDCVSLMMGELNEIEVDFAKTLLTQNYQFRGQKEWRLITGKQPDDEFCIRFSTELIRSIYIGAAVPKNKADELTEVTRQLDGNINIYQANCSESNYEFMYDKYDDNND